MKIALIIACALIVLGLVIGIIGLALIGFNFKEMSTMKTVENTYTVAQPFSHIAIEASIAKIEIAPATDGICRVDCEENDKLYFTVSVSGDTLCIDLVDGTKWYDFIGVNAGNVSATVYLPESAYASLSIKNSTGAASVASGFTFGSATIKSTTGSLRFSGNVTGDLNAKLSTGTLTLTDAAVGGNLTMESSSGSIKTSNVSIGGTLNVETDTGSVKMNTVTCATLEMKYETGSVTLTDVLASEKMEIDGSTGSLRFERADAPTIKIETSTGSVRGTLRSEKIFYAKSSTGSVNVPRGTQGGICEIETSTGSIDITIE